MVTSTKALRFKLRRDSVDLPALVDLPADPLAIGAAYFETVLPWDCQSDTRLPILTAEQIAADERRLAQEMGDTDWQRIIEQGIAAGRVS